MFVMKVILYKTKHGSTFQVAKMINEYIQDGLLMNFDHRDDDILEKADMIIIGSPVYYGKLDRDIVSFIMSHQDLLVKKKYSLYVVGIFPTEFMSFVTQAFDYEILKNIKVIVGLGGVLHYSDLTITDKMVLQIMNMRFSVIPKEKEHDIFENINEEEIRIFAKKIEMIK